MVTLMMMGIMMASWNTAIDCDGEVGSEGDCNDHHAGTPICDLSP